MSLTLRWHGLHELRAALRTLPDDLTRDATPIVQQAADDAATAMRTRYPRRTGRLANSLIVEARPRGPHTVSVRVTNTALYARYFEFGTRYAPPGRVFIPTRNQYQRSMYATLARLLPRYNFRPRGDATS